MPSEATRSTPQSSNFTPPGQRGRYSQPNLPNLLISYNDGSTSNSGSTDRRIRMSQPILNSSLSGLTFPMNMTKGRLSYTSLRTSGDNYIGLKIDEEHLSAPNFHNSLISKHDSSHVLKRDNIKKRDRLSQPTLVTGDYFPGRGQKRLSQPCLTYVRDSIGNSNSALKMKRISSPPKSCQRERIHQLDLGGRINRRDIQQQQQQQYPDMTKFNRDRFSIPELETANDLRLIAGTPKQRFSLDSSLGETKRRSRLLPIASSPISENYLSNANGNNNEGKRKPADGLETVLIASASPLLPQVENALEPSQTQSFVVSQRMSVPDISTSSLRRLLDPPAKQRHSITGNLRQCLLPGIKKIPKKDIQDLRSSDCQEIESEKINVQRHYSYTYETKCDSKFILKETMSALPRKKFLESNFDRNEQVITTVIESDVPVILTSNKKSEKFQNFYSGNNPKWMRKYIGDGNQQDNDITKSERPRNQASKRKAWQNSKRESFDSVEGEKNLNGVTKVFEKKSPTDKNQETEIFFNIEEGNFNFERRNSFNRNSGWDKTYGVEDEESESEESTSI